MIKMHNIYPCFFTLQVQLQLTYFVWGKSGFAALLVTLSVLCITDSNVGYTRQWQEAGSINTSRRLSNSADKNHIFYIYDN